MAATVTWEVLRDLAAFRAAQGCAISLYLDLDASDSPTPESVDTRINALLDAVSRWESANQSELTREQKEGVRADLDRLRASSRTSSAARARTGSRSSATVSTARGTRSLSAIA
jgi:hypothetical protein